MISVLIITRERAQLLQKCLSSLRGQRLATPLQVVVVINGEDLTTQEILKGFPEAEVLLVNEPLPPGAARNRGLPRLKGEWSFLLDDDAQLPPGYFDYWQKTLRALPQAEVVGGPDSAPPESSGLARAVSLSLSSPLCTGATHRRHRARGLKALPADETILSSCNLWVRTHWWRRGIKFPEDFRRGEETVVLQAIRRSTSEMWWVPGLGIWHARRSSLSALARASWGGGFHRARILSQQGGPAWFWFAPLFVILHLSIVAMPPFFTFLATVWLTMVGVVSLLLCFEAKQLLLWPWVLFLHWGIPFSYGVGFLQYQWERE
jgi:glycosyltransferase involved in cell wall biosynthesis